MTIACLETISTGFRETRKGNANKNRQTGKERSPFLEQPHCTEERDKLLDLINPKTTHPIAYHLLNIKWAVFGTITWDNEFYRKDNPTSEKLRFKDFYLLIKRACQLLHLNKDDILFYVTNERGRDCECHLHFLIGKKGLQAVSDKKLSLTLNYLWNNNLQLPNSDQVSNSVLKGGRGVCDIRPFNQWQHIKNVLYVCKRGRYQHGREYAAVYKLSDALAKRISELNTQESPKDQKTPLALIKKTLSRCLIVLCKGLLLNCGFGIILRPVKGLIRNKDPPMTDRKKSGATVYENLGFILSPALLGGA